MIHQPRRFAIEQIFNEESIRKVRPSSARPYEKSKAASLRDMARQNEEERALKPIKRVDTFHIHQTLYRVKREEEQLVRRMQATQGRTQILQETDVCRLVNSNDINHIIKLNARKHQDSESSLWVQQQKQNYLQSKINRKALQEKMKSHQSQGQLTTRGDSSREIRANRTDGHIEVFGRPVGFKGKKADRGQIRRRIENYIDKYHSQGQHSTSRFTQPVIPEERDEDHYDDNRIILTQPTKEDNYGLNINAKQIFSRKTSMRPQSA